MGKFNIGIQLGKTPEQKLVDSFFKAHPERAAALGINPDEAYKYPASAISQLLTIQDKSDTPTAKLEEFVNKTSNAPSKEAVLKPSLNIQTQPQVDIGASPELLRSLPPNVLENIFQSQIQKQQELSAGIIKKQIEDKETTEKSTQSSSLFMRRFAESHGEVNEKFPGAGEATFKGKAKRWAAAISAEQLGTLPKTEAFLKRMKPIANAQARMVEGGRVTDQDRQVYAEAMVNAVTAPDESNIILAADAIVEFHNKGANIKPLLDDLTSQDIPITNEIVKEILRLVPAEDKERLLK